MLSTRSKVRLLVPLTFGLAHWRQGRARMELGCRSAQLRGRCSRLSKAKTRLVLFLSSVAREATALGHLLRPYATPAASARSQVEMTVSERPAGSDIATVTRSKRARTHTLTLE